MEKQILTTPTHIAKQEISYRSILIVIRYPMLLGFMGFISMALFHFPLYLNRKIKFYKLMGTGRNGSFDIWPDLSQWSIMIFYDKQNFEANDAKNAAQYFMGPFISFWLRIFQTRVRYFLLAPYAGHGTWDKQAFVVNRKSNEEPVGKIAVLTRATIRLSGLIPFWKAVPSASFQLDQHQGFQYSIGIGEVPFVKQATFSIWSSESDMKAYAYQMKAHQDVIRKTRTENWYAEEMFLRFRVLDDFS